VSKRIAHTGGVGAIKHIRRRLDLRRARLDGTSQEGFVVIDEDVQAGDAAADGVRLVIQPVVWIAIITSEPQISSSAWRILPLG
jgi:hypothetical protein